MIKLCRKIFIFIFVVFPFVGCSKCNTITWPSINKKIKQDFPKIKTISVEELSQLMDQHKKFVLLDVREKNEYEESHIKGAILSSQPSQLKIPKNTKIIAYCSVGYRSARYVKKLNKLGYTQAYNLKGSIFEWANKGHPVYRGAKKTFSVHPYDQEWGVLLDKKYHKK